MFIQTKSPKITGVVCITILYHLGFIALTASLGHYSALPYIAAQIALVTVIYIAHRYVQYALPMLWALSLWGFFNLAGGFISFPDTLGRAQYLRDVSTINGAINYNTLVHVYGFAVACWLSWQTLCNIIHTRYQRRLMPSTGLLLIVVTSSMGYGALYEMIEFIVNKSFYPEIEGKHADTCWNMIANTAGASMAAVIIKIRNL